MTSLPTKDEALALISGLLTIGEVAGKPAYRQMLERVLSEQLGIIREHMPPELQAQDPRLIKAEALLAKLMGET